MKTTVLMFNLSIFIFLTTNYTKAQCNLDDWMALKALYQSTDGDNWTNNTGWAEIYGSSPTTNCDLENLYGVELDENGRVYYIILADNQLEGNLPSELFYLSHLNSLNLSTNKINGALPIEFNSLVNLRQLWLFENELIGNIPPELGDLTNLTHLHLHKNKFSGSIPLELGNLINLTYLSLSANQLNGSIPIQLGNLINLTVLSLWGNDLSGNIPLTLGNLSQLTNLNLGYNKLNGNIPPLDNLNNLEFLILNSNLLEGVIPPAIGNLSFLKELKLFTNRLSGNIPVTFGNLNNLEILFLSSNQLDGNIPSELGNLINLTNLGLWNNQLTGNIPAELGNLNQLKYFWTQNNRLTGNIPAELGNLTNLKELRLFSNLLSGSIPAQLAELSNLNLLDVQDNNLSGCFNFDLHILCNQLTSSIFYGNPNISDNNYFDANWEDFCANEAGKCDPSEPDPTTTNVYPGDKNNDGIVDQKDVSLAGFYLEMGPPRAPEHQNTDWQGYPCDDWDDNLPFNGANIKHLDCNGDGTISTIDADAVLDNLREMHDEGGQQIGTPFFEETNYQIYLQPIDDLDDNNLLQVNVVLESKNGNSLNLQGGYFTIDYNNINTNIINAAMNFPNSWLGINDINMITSYQNFPNNNQIEIGFSKTNGTNSTGKGIIGQLTFVLDNNVMRTANSLLDFEVIEIGVHDSQGNIQPIEEQMLQVGLNESNCQTNWTITEDSPFYNVYKSNGTIATDGFVLVGKEQQVQYSANRVRLEEGFSVRAGANFKVRYGSCN